MHNLPLRNEFNKAFSEIFSGDSVLLRLRFLNPSQEGINVSNDNIWLTFKRKNEDLKTLQLKYTIPENSQSEAGYAYLEIPASETKLLSGRYHVDMKLFRDTSVATLFNGFVVIRKSVTRK